MFSHIILVPLFKLLFIPRSQGAPGVNEGCSRELRVADIIVIILLRSSSMEFGSVICSAMLTVSLLNVEKGMKSSALDDSLHQKVQPHLMKCWQAVEQSVWACRNGTCCSKESDLQHLMHSPGQSVGGFWAGVGSNSHQRCTHSVVYQVLSLWRGHSDLLGTQAVT